LILFNTSCPVLPKSEADSIAVFKLVIISNVLFPCPSSIICSANNGTELASAIFIPFCNCVIHF